MFILCDKSSMWCWNSCSPSYLNIHALKCATTSFLLGLGCPCVETWVCDKKEERADIHPFHPPQSIPKPHSITLAFVFNRTVYIEKQWGTIASNKYKDISCKQQWCSITEGWTCQSLGPPFSLMYCQNCLLVVVDLSKGIKKGELVSGQLASEPCTVPAAVQSSPFPILAMW